MSNVISFKHYRRTRRDTHYRPRRAITQPQGGKGLVSIGVVSAELVRRLMQTD